MPGQPGAAHNFPMSDQAEMFPGLPPARQRGPKGKTLGPKGGTHYIQPRGYAAYPGTGPKGEMCKTCLHYCRISNRGGTRQKFYLKCGLARYKWTGGPGSDILAKSPACEKWAPATAESKEKNKP